jgi:hypothetical protein
MAHLWGLTMVKLDWGRLRCFLLTYRWFAGPPALLAILALPFVILKMTQVPGAARAAMLTEALYAPVAFAAALLAYLLLQLAVAWFRLWWLEVTATMRSSRRR